MVVAADVADLVWEVPEPTFPFRALPVLPAPCPIAPLVDPVAPVTPVAVAAPKKLFKILLLAELPVLFSVGKEGVPAVNAFELLEVLLKLKEFML